MLLYAYARGKRSSRGIERACREDVAFKTIAMLETPDHATIARFVERHEAALAELFGQVLGLCAEAGLVRPGVVAIDGTKMAGNASRESTLTLRRSRGRSWRRRRRPMRPRMSCMARRAGMSCLSSCAPRQGGPSSSAARASARAEAGDQPSEMSGPSRSRVEEEFGFDAERIVARHQGREGWTREARRQLEQRRWEHAGSCSRAREDRLLLAGERLEAERDAQSRPTGPMRITGRRS